MIDNSELIDTLTRRRMRVMRRPDRVRAWSYLCYGVDTSGKHYRAFLTFDAIRNQWYAGDRDVPISATKAASIARKFEREKIEQFCWPELPA